VAYWLPRGGPGHEASRIGVCRDPLRELHAQSPDAAREAAYKLWLAYEAGDGFGEWLWHWCQEDGLDPDEIVALRREVAAAAIARLRCRGHSND
jgi:hypothetical protein